MQNTSDRSPIQFQNAEEFQSRPNYFSELSCSSTELDYIVGKYGFSREKSLKCGLNGCHTTHWHGFVIALKSGQETHCGQVCGAKAFGVSWDEVEATFQRKEAERDRSVALQKIKDDGVSVLQRCGQLITKCGPLESAVRTVLEELSRETALVRAFENIVKNGGRIMGEVEQSDFMRGAKGSGKRDLVLLATVDGTSSIGPSKDTVRSLKFQVEIPVKDLMSQSLELLTAKQIEAHLKLLNDVNSTFIRAEAFAKHAERFLIHDNLEKLEMLLPQLPKRSRTDRARAILRRLHTATSSAE
ncbi:MAG: hypothetical protein RL462_1121 [Pseudomonadota bacterium]|jgi:hypothetical protein